MNTYILTDTMVFNKKLIKCYNIKTKTLEENKYETKIFFDDVNVLTMIYSLQKPYEEYIASDLHDIEKYIRNFIYQFLQVDEIEFVVEFMKYFELKMKYLAIDSENFVLIF